MTPAIHRVEIGEVSFTVQTIDCIACSQVFRRSLTKVDGVLEVRELPITNKVMVRFDVTRIDRGRLVQEILRVSKKAGLDGRLIIHR